MPVSGRGLSVRPSFESEPPDLFSLGAYFLRAYGVAVTLGHARVQITLDHYVHLDGRTVEAEAQFVHDVMSLPVTKVKKLWPEWTRAAQQVNAAVMDHVMGPLFNE